MKIVMLGDSAVGKTTLMVSTYGMMSEQSFKGFRVQCTDSRAHDKLVRAYRDFCSRGECHEVHTHRHPRREYSVQRLHTAPE